MTAFVAEGKRLGIKPPPPSMPQSSRPLDSEGLCVTGCVRCRDFRDKVRAAIAAEKAAFAAAFDEAFTEPQVEKATRPSRHHKAARRFAALQERAANEGLVLGVYLTRAANLTGVGAFVNLRLRQQSDADVPLHGQLDIIEDVISDWEKFS